MDCWLWPGGKSAYPFCHSRPGTTTKRTVSRLPLSGRPLTRRDYNNLKETPASRRSAVVKGVALKLPSPTVSVINIRQRVGWSLVYGL